MDYNTHNRSTKQKILAFELSLIIAFISTIVIYLIDSFLLKHTEFSPLTEIQFYGVVFIVVLGLVMGLLFYREEKDEIIEVESDIKTKMIKKKQKKYKKSNASKR
ncbi:MAG TPA: hypothetical protein VMW20_01275 [Candidatus Nanoarchaeia archaeon]|nr:hypothetical protein [Candidatus Nanoarchaeia archaeon]